MSGQRRALKICVQRTDARRAPLFAVMVLATALVGCHGSAPTGQVIARVDGEEITSTQLQQLLDRLPAPQDVAVRARTAQSLIDETLFASEAEQAGLAKDPRIARDIDAARRAILAQAFLRTVAPPRPVTDADIAQYYRRYAFAFANRRKYAVTDMVVPGGSDLDQYVRPLGTSMTLEQLGETLRKRGTAFQTKAFAFVSDSISPDMARQFSILSPGASYSFREGTVRHFGRIEQVEASPVSLADATETIRGAVVMSRVDRAARAKLAALRAEGKVEMGDLGKTILAQRSTTEATSPAPGAPGPEKSPEDRSGVIKRGLSGL